MAFTQDSVNQLVKQAATQAGGSLSYADASNAARNLGIPDTMFQGALSTGLITGAPLATQVANTSGMGVQGIGVNTSLPAADAAVSKLPVTTNATTTSAAGSGPLTPALAANLMQRAMTTGVSTPELDRYGGYNAVKALYDAGGGSYNTGDFDKTFLQNAANQVASTGVGNLLSLAATNTPLTAAGIAAMQNNGIGALNIADNTRRYSDPANLAIENANYLQELKDLKTRIDREKITNPQTLTPLYQSLTAKSTPAAVASAYAQLVSGAGGDTPYNQTEAVARLQKLGIPDSVIRQGYNFYLGSPAATTGATTGATTAATVGSTQQNQAGSVELNKQFGVGSDVPAYFTQNPDVAAAYANRLNDPNLASTVDMTPEQFAAKHYADYGSKEGRADLKTSGILSGFKYANDSGLSENDMRQALGDDTFNTYKTGFTNYAKTGIANILADNKLSFDEARTQVKFGRDYGYDAQKLADLTGTKKEVFDAIYKNYDDTTNRIVDSALGAEDVKTDSDRVIKNLALQKQFGFTDEDLAKASDYDVKKLKAALDPVRNFGTDLNKILNNTDSTLIDTKNVIAAGRNNGAINKLFGTNLDTLDTKIAEIEDRWKGFEGVEPMHAQRVYDQISQQREKLGDQYYRGVFGDPKIMAATLARKGVDTLTDIVQKDKYEATPAEKRYTTKDGAPLEDLGNGTFATNDGSVVPKNQVKTVYGYNEQELREGPEGGYYESKFVPLSDKDVDKEGNYQKLVGKVAIDKDTGEEIADLDGRIASQNSSGGLKKKFNTLNVAFTKDGVPVVTASSQKAGLGALVQDLAPIISMALPFVLPGLGSALSGMLPGAGVAASGATAAIAPTLMNQALTQGIISGGLSTLGGGQFEKGFLGGAVSPVINTGISSLLPAGINPDLAKSITSAGTGAFRGALGGGDFSDILKGGITSGLANYGVNTALGASGLTPQQLNFATGIVAPLLQGQKINPMTAFGTLANVGQQTQGARP
jgi:hypothetical protein